MTEQVLSLRRIQPPEPRLGLVRLRAGGEGAEPLRHGGCTTRLSAMCSLDALRCWGVTSMLRGRRSGGLGGTPLRDDADLLGATWLPSV